MTTTAFGSGPRACVRSDSRRGPSPATGNHRSCHGPFSRGNGVSRRQFHKPGMCCTAATRSPRSFHVRDPVIKASRFSIRAIAAPACLRLTVPEAFLLKPEVLLAMLQVFSLILSILLLILRILLLILGILLLISSILFLVLLDLLLLPTDLLLIFRLLLAM